MSAYQCSLVKILGHSSIGVSRSVGETVIGVRFCTRGCCGVRTLERDSTTRSVWRKVERGPSSLHLSPRRRRIRVHTQSRPLSTVHSAPTIATVTDVGTRQAPLFKMRGEECTLSHITSQSYSPFLYFTQFGDGHSRVGNHDPVERVGLGMVGECAMGCEEEKQSVGLEQGRQQLERLSMGRMGEKRMGRELLTGSSIAGTDNTAETPRDSPGLAATARCVVRRRRLMGRNVCEGTLV